METVAAKGRRGVLEGTGYNKPHNKDHSTNVFSLTFLLEKLMATQHQATLLYKCNALLSDVVILKDCETLCKELLTCA